jgi:hypothetical protein
LQCIVALWWEEMRQMPSQILEDFVDFPTFANELDRCVTTIERWAKAPGGLPYTKIGNRRLIHVPTAREWLMGRMRRPNPRRKASSETAPASAA